MAFEEGGSPANGHPPSSNSINASHPAVIVDIMYGTCVNNSWSKAIVNLHNNESIKVVLISDEQNQQPISNPKLPVQSGSPAKVNSAQAQVGLNLK